MKPRLLDLFCCEGGASMGYARAGFDVVGVDIEERRRRGYPFEFHQGDALEFVKDHGHEFDVIAASPPCQRFSVAASIHDNAHTHPDLVEPTRAALIATGKPYVIENVPTAPLLNPVMLCGWAMGLRHIKRHRNFESNVWLMSPGCACPDGDTVSVFGHSGEDRRKSSIATGRNRAHVPLAEVKEMMGVEWMKDREAVSESIPPAYTEYLGWQLIEHLQSDFWRNA